MSKETSAFLHLYSGSLSGFASTILLQPIDLLKTKKQQLIKHATTKSNVSISYLIRDVLRNKGVLGFWTGVTPSLLRNVIGVGLYFQSLSQMRKLLTPASQKHLPRPQLSVLSDLTAGAVARTSAGYILMPFTLLKARYEASLQLGQTVPQAFRDIFLKQGLQGLWRGSLMTAARDAPYSGLFMVLYERTRNVLGRTKPAIVPLWTIDSLSAMLSGSFATLATSPFDMLKTQRQIDPLRHTSALVSSRIIMQQRGLLGFFDGSSLRILRKAGSSAIAFTLYEILLRRWQSK